MKVRHLIAATAVGSAGVVAVPAAISGTGSAYAAGKSPVTCFAYSGGESGPDTNYLSTPRHTAVFTTPHQIPICPEVTPPTPG